MRKSFVLASSGISLLAVVAFTPTDAASAPRSYVTGHYVVSVDGTPVPVKSLSGGAMEADIAANDLGPDNMQKKHVSNIKYTDVGLSVSASPAKAIADWIKGTLSTARTVKSGFFASTDASGKELARTTWTNAILTEIAFPELDAASKEEANIDLKFAMDQARFTFGAGQNVAAPQAPKVKSGPASNFRMTLSGIDTSHVMHIDPIVFKLAIASDQIGVVREPTKHPAKATIEDVGIVVPEAHASSLYAWANAWFINGNHLEGDEKTATVELLGANMKDVIYRVTLSHVGLKRIGTDPSSTETLRKVRADLYVEGVSVEFF